MSSAKSRANYRVLPLSVVQRDAKKLLTPRQLREGIGLAKRLRDYPAVSELNIAPCGEGMELYLESPAINPQGRLRADLHRANHRIRQLKANLA